MSVQSVDRRALPGGRSVRSAAGVLPAVLLFLAGSWGFGCGEEPAAPEPVARPVKLVEFGGAGGTGLLEYPGEVSPATNAEVAFEVAGKLIEFPVTESQPVAQGDLLAKLDPRDYQSDLLAAEAKAAAARAEYGRTKALFDRDVAPKQDLEMAQRNLEVWNADAAKARKAVEDTMLRAPFDGIIARKLADDFQNVQAKEPIVLLQTSGSLEIVVNVPERDYARLRPGLSIEERNRRVRAEVVLSALPDLTFPAKLKEFSTAADPTTRTFAATFSFDAPPDVNVMPGMTARLLVHGVSVAANAATIPVQAATDDAADGAHVWVVDPQTMRVRRTAVTLGALTGDSVEVKSGLQPGDWVVTSGVHALSDGMQVRRFEN